MLTREQAKQQLSDLGIVRWDTNPPSEGVIRWFTADGEVVAAADYQVVLSVGPGAKYTMGHAISAYGSLGIPVAPKVDEEPVVVEDVKGDADVWARAEAVGTAVGAEFVYQCSTLIVAVFEFRLV